MMTAAPKFAFLWVMTAILVLIFVGSIRTEFRQNRIEKSLITIDSNGTQGSRAAVKTLQDGQQQILDRVEQNADHIRELCDKFDQCMANQQ